MIKLSISEFGNRRSHYKSKYGHNYTSTDTLRNEELKFLCALGTNFQGTYERMYIGALLAKV